ncbi:hypothetical protein JCM3766R1_006941 [Sporobolomyces carnicolor]
MLARSSLVTVALFASAARIASCAPSPFSSTRIAHVVSDLAKRSSSSAASSSGGSVSQSSFLQDLFGYETPSSEKSCAVPLADLETCAKGTDQATIAACACSTETLGDLRTCAAAISTSTKSSENATAVVVAYNSFVDLCQTEGLATVTGTVAAGASTSTRAASSSSFSPSPSSSTSTSTAASDRPTYNAQSTPASTASVPALETGTASAAATNNNNNSSKSATNAAAGSTSAVVALVTALFFGIATLTLV